MTYHYFATIIAWELMLIYINLETLSGNQFIIIVIPPPPLLPKRGLTTLL